VAMTGGGRKVDDMAKRQGIGGDSGGSIPSNTDPQKTQRERGKIQGSETEGPITKEGGGKGDASGEDHKCLVVKINHPTTRKGRKENSERKGG